MGQVGEALAARLHLAQLLAPRHQHGVRARQWPSMNPTSASVAVAGTITLGSPAVRQARSASAASIRFSERIATVPGPAPSSIARRPRARTSTRAAVCRQESVRFPVRKGISKSGRAPYSAARRRKSGPTV